MGLSLYTAAAVEPVTLAEVRSHCRIDDHSDDAYLVLLIKAARQFAETYSRRQFVTATWKLYLDRFPFGANETISDSQSYCRDAIILPRPPLQSITSIAYIDANGASQSFTNYTSDIYGEPGRVQPAYGYTWPTARLQPNAITITYKAGYGGSAPANDAASVAAVPQPIKHAIMMLAANWYENREPSNADANTAPKVLFAVEALLDSCSYGSYTE